MRIKLESKFKKNINKLFEIADVIENRPIVQSGHSDNVRLGG